MQGISSKAAGGIENKRKYNGNELQNKEFRDGSGLVLFDFNAKTFDQQLGRFIQVDPLTDEGGQESWTPYHSCFNNPILRNDPTGLYAPIYDTGGNFLGTDDQGLKGKAIVMDKEKFQQGMAHQDAVQNNLGIEGFEDVAASKKFLESYDGLSARPDYDGFVTIEEGIAWAKAHPNLDNDNVEHNGMGNAKPSDYLYLDASKMDFGTLHTKNLELNTVVGVNLLYKTDFSSSASIATTYALGRTKLKLLDEKTGSVEVVNGHHNIYNWDRQGNALRRTLIHLERMRTGINDSHGFPLLIYGKGKVDVFSPSPVKLSPYGF